jgi:integrase
MAKVIAPLTEMKVKRAKPKEKLYKMFDGNGLYLEIKPTGKKTWRIKYRLYNKEKTYTIGEYPIIPLSQARGITQEIKNKILQGIDPVQDRKEKLITKELSNKKIFKNIVEEFLTLKSKEWSEVYYKKQVRRIEIYILPFLGNKPINLITKNEIVKIIKDVRKIVTPTTKISNKSEVTKRIYLILRQIYTFALHNDYVDVNILDKIDINNLIPKEKVKHFDAITDINELKKLYKDIQSYPSVNKFALEFLALTALRPGNIQNLKWEWIDWDKKIINFPAEVMKIRKDYRLPLTESLIHILEEMKQISLSINIYVFCSPVNFAKRMSENTLNQAIKKMGYNHRAHGWRASFSTLCYEHQKEHGFSSEVIETQLAHSVGNKVTRAYMRSDFLEERRELLQWWEKFLSI